MRQHRFASHTPDELRRLSNLGHIMEGLLFGGVGILALLDSLGMAAWASIAWPLLIMIAGVLLLLLLYPFHPLGDWPAIWRDPQQREHTIIAVAIALAGGAELLRRANANWAYGWPVALLIVGGLFLTHAQHGTSAAAAKAVRRHRILGATIIVAGLLRVAALAGGGIMFGVLWSLVLLVAAVQLFLYREPEGAYETGDGHSGHGV